MNKLKKEKIFKEDKNKIIQKIWENKSWKGEWNIQKKCVEEKMEDLKAFLKKYKYKK